MNYNIKTLFLTKIIMSILNILPSLYASQEELEALCSSKTNELEFKEKKDSLDLKDDIFEKANIIKKHAKLFYRTSPTQEELQIIQKKQEQEWREWFLATENDIYQILNYFSLQHNSPSYETQNLDDILKINLEYNFLIIINIPLKIIDLLPEYIQSSFGETAKTRKDRLYNDLLHNSFYQMQILNYLILKNTSNTPPQEIFQNKILNFLKDIENQLTGNIPVIKENYCLTLKQLIQTYIFNNHIIASLIKGEQLQTILDDVEWGYKIFDS